MKNIFLKSSLLFKVCSYIVYIILRGRLTEKINEKKGDREGNDKKRGSK